MTSSPGNRPRALLLALLLALGMSVTFVQGSLMKAEIAVSAEAGHPGPSGCDGCSGDDGNVDASMCLSVCGSATHALLPRDLVALPSASQASFQTRYLVLGGRSHSPDPGPPKPLTLV
jgi:hypothetical protein